MNISHVFKRRSNLRNVAFSCAITITAITITVLFANHAIAELPEGIVWYGVLEDGLEEAALSGKPILMTSAAPQCSSVPGMW